MMKKGFNMLIPQDYLLSFAPYELELLISGLRVVDVDVLESKTKYTDYNKSSLIIQWLWEILREYPEVCMYVCSVIIIVVVVVVVLYV